ncbi:hypothetical protein V1509DRAFT_638557 [Lipomyces kononenkoae]
MAFRFLVASLAIAMLCPVLDARAVFSHYMVGTVYQNHAQQDIDNAQAMEGFALNIGDPSQDFVKTTLEYMFSYAAPVGFKLYVSMDVYAYGNSCYQEKKSCNGPFDYKWIFDAYIGSSAYYRVDNRPLISSKQTQGTSRSKKWSHVAWRPLVSSFINAFRNGVSSLDMVPADGSLAVGAAWYKPIQVHTIACLFDGTSQYYDRPDGFYNGSDYLYWSVVFNSDQEGYTVTVVGDGGNIVTHLHSGLNMGYSSGVVSTGPQMIQLKDSSGTVLYTATGGMCVSGGCPLNIYMSNYQVVPLAKGDATAHCTLWTTDNPACMTPGEGCKAVAGTTSAADDWQHVTCTNPGVTDANQNGSYRWNSRIWIVLSFPEQISNLFHGPEYLECDVIMDNNPCTSSVVECQDVSYPAGFMILNSFETVTRAMSNFYSAIGDSRNNIDGDIGLLASTFAPIPQQSFSTKLALDILSLGFALALSPLWNSYLKTVPLFKDNGNLLGTVKDWVNPMISNSITIAKDAEASQEEALGIQNEISARLEYIVEQWQNMTTVADAMLYNGSSSSVNILHTAITNGQLLESQYQDLSSQQVQQIVEQALYAMIIPYSWTLSVDWNPVVINSTTSCNQSPKLQHISTDTQKVAGACVNNIMYYLVGAAGVAFTGVPPYDQTFHDFSELPGTTQLDGTQWGGLTVQDLCAGAVNGFWANNANGWAMADATQISTLNHIFDDGIQAPGVVQIPICTEDEAWENWFLSKHSSNFPCN